MEKVFILGKAVLKFTALAALIGAILFSIAFTSYYGWQRWVAVRYQQRGYTDAFNQVLQEIKVQGELKISYQGETGEQFIILIEKPDGKSK